MALSWSSWPSPTSASTTAVVSTIASVATSAAVLYTVTTSLIPSNLQDYLSSAASTLLRRLSSQVSVTIDEFDGLAANHMYKAVEVYLSSRLPPSARRLRVTMNANDRGPTVAAERGEEILDAFDGAEYRWTPVSRSVPCTAGRGGGDSGRARVESRAFELRLHKRDRDKALGSYLSHILEKSRDMKREQKALKLHTAIYDNLYGAGGTLDVWAAVNLDHPARFETLAMEEEVKRAVMEDLNRFVKRKDYYKRVGKAWKRGYLLYGPPGTGKSSLVAAMANYLKFDVYDLELSELHSNSSLRMLLIATANRSILVVEDIDCALNLHSREMAKESRGRHDERITLSGLLNFIDGLWSSCGDERIIVFTTNHKDRLDPALLRPGRMDMHVEMSYCTPCGFRLLVSNYHGVTNHPLFEKIEMLIRDVQVTPAEVAGELMKSDDVQTALEGLLCFIQHKKNEADESVR